MLLLLPGAAQLLRLLQFSARAWLLPGDPAANLPLPRCHVPLLNAVMIFTPFSQSTGICAPLLLFGV